MLNVILLFEFLKFGFFEKYSLNLKNVPYFFSMYNQNM